MRIEFDPDKDRINREKHGVSLAFGNQVWGDPMMLVLPSLRAIDGEERYKAVGLVEGRLWTAVHVHRADMIRMISVRKATMASKGSMIALKADPNDPEDFDVTVEALEQALAEREARLRGPQVAPVKQQVTLRLDPEVLAKFRATGRGWQSRINAVLRAAEV